MSSQAYLSFEQFLEVVGRKYPNATEYIRTAASHSSGTFKKKYNDLMNGRGIPYLSVSNLVAASYHPTFTKEEWQKISEKTLPDISEATRMLNQG